MTRRYFQLSLASAALFAFSASSGFASPAPTSTRATLQQIENASVDIARAADFLTLVAKNPNYDPGAHMDSLYNIRADVNKIGRELQVLQDERGTLAPWQVEAVDKVMPLMKEVADNAEKATADFNSDRSHLWSTSYPDCVSAIYKEAGTVSSTLKEYLALDKTHEAEQRLEHNIGNPAGF